MCRWGPRSRSPSWPCRRPLRRPASRLRCRRLTNSPRRCPTIPRTLRTTLWAGRRAPGDPEDPAAAADFTETPQVTRLRPLAGGPGAGFLLRAPLPGGGRGFLSVCVACDNLELSAAASFGPFPEDGRPVQLAVRGPLGDVHRFGPVVRHAGTASGFHSPLIDDPDEARRFVAAVFRQGALISNGYRSLWNRVDESENAGVRFFAETCD